MWKKFEKRRSQLRDLNFIGAAHHRYRETKDPIKHPPASRTDKHEKPLTVSNGARKNAMSNFSTASFGKSAKQCTNVVSPAKAFIVVGRPGVFPDSDMSIVGGKMISQTSVKAVEVARRDYKMHC